jgi:hypothetical protein
VTDTKHLIEIWIMMNESGAFVSDDEETTAELAVSELGEDEDIRSVKLKIKMSPPSSASKPIEAECELN